MVVILSTKYELFRTYEKSDIHTLQAVQSSLNDDLAFKLNYNYISSLKQLLIVGEKNEAMNNQKITVSG